MLGELQVRAEVSESVKEEREAARNTIYRLRDVVTKENREFNDTEKAEWDKANAAFDATTRIMENQSQKFADDFDKSAERREIGGIPVFDARFDGVKPGAEDSFSGSRSYRQSFADRRGRSERSETVADVAFAGWMSAQVGRPLTQRQATAMQRMGVTAAQKFIDVPYASRAQSVGSATLGGNTVPTTFARSLEIAMKEWSATREVCDVFQTEGVENLDYPTANDTTVSGSQLAEAASIGAAVDINFAKVTFGAYKFSSGLVLCSAELLQDNAVDLGNQIGALLGERIGRGQEVAFTTGTGTGQPQGIITGATLGVTAASATAIAADELITLYHSVDPAYRRDPSFGWMFHDNIASALRRLKDSQQRYLWGFDLERGQRELLLGKPVTINMSMASAITTGQKTVL